MALLLTDGGADVSAADKCGSTPLHDALKYRRAAIARLLRGEGANVSLADKNGSTPLHKAAQNGKEAVARLLMDRGAVWCHHKTLGLGIAH